MRKQINHARRNASFNVAELRRRGYKQIGRGAFSRVMVHPDAPDVVIKIGSRVSRYHHLSHLNDGFPEFAELIFRRLISSKFYPKIYDLRIEGDHFICVMKRYQKRRGSKLPEALNSVVHTLRGTFPAAPAQHMNRFRRALEPFIDYRYVPDLHSANVMQDEHGTPILTDPICIRV
ncbi:hypothetical protein JYP52_01305 [Nitratireductor aquibiodomus]|uniref:hypothetical protein n=1 Tax=Nitratireductor aquibiodomus TaxID=204799 RepID=UPI0019D33B49|nr:hypothetical protein [Nitratireductor aquibiodomus]MBN7759759.1 hypothetical protein [Nitratireductor aquibiodomus]